MKFKEIKELTLKELSKKLRETREEVFELRMKNSLGQVNNPLQIRGLRRDVARIMTAVQQKLK